MQVIQVQAGLRRNQVNLHHRFRSLAHVVSNLLEESQILIEVFDRRLRDEHVRAGGNSMADAFRVRDLKSQARIGRMAVLEPHRRHGVGSAVLLKLMELARERGVKKVSLAGQLHAIPFYERFGFVARGDVFVEAGIEHRMMDRELA